MKQLKQYVNNTKCIQNEEVISHKIIRSMDNRKSSLAKEDIKARKNIIKREANKKIERV